MIILNNISKSFGTRVLIENASCNINPGDKIGLVGRNGTGKSTLFKMILGDEPVDSGSINIPKDYKIGHLEQHIRFTEKTVIDEAAKNISEKWIVEKILSGLGFSDDDMLRNPIEFSGGYQIRINLAKVLASSPDMLLLDEPGNYLDVVSIRWLSGFLKTWKGEFILITHDRGFMDSVINCTIGIHRTNIRKIPGNTEKYYEQIIVDEEVYEKTRLNDEKKRKEVELFIERFRAKATLATRVKSKEKMLAKQARKEKLVEIKDLDFKFKYEKFEPKTIMELRNIGFSYDNVNFLIKDLSLVIEKDDRIAIIGKNGKGKTTLLKILAGRLNALEGELKEHSQINKAYFEQTNIENLDDNLTVEEEIDKSITDRDNYRARNIAGLMMFEGDDALKKIKVLSGGEKSRVLLGKLLCSPSNILMLDEPTNHFDMQSCDSILEAIDEYPGAVVIVTHNEMFLHAVPDKLIVFDSEKVFVFNGGYQDFLDKIGWGSEKDEKQEKKKIFNNKDSRKIRADIVAEKSKILKPIETKLKKIETEIGLKESKLSELNVSFEEATFSGDGIKIKELSISLTSLESEISRLYEELEVITCEYEEKALIYDEKLNEYK